MTRETPIPQEIEDRTVAGEGGSWLYAHIGRLLAIAGGFVVVGLLAFLASLGFYPALYLLVFGMAGMLLIIGGGKIHRA